MRWGDLNRKNVRLVLRTEKANKWRPGGMEGQSPESGQGGGLGGSHWLGWPHSLNLKKNV